jgi:hypothetical protein
MPRIDNNEVGDAFAEALKNMLSKKKLSKTAAARELGISRQAFHNCLLGRLPRRKTLNRAVQLWNLKLVLGRHSFDKGSFGPNVGPTSPTVTQRSLWEALDSIGDEDLQIRTKRVGRVLRVDVRIEIPA